MLTHICNILLNFDISQNISLFIFQFPQHWPSHIFSMAIFPRQVPIPVDWLQTKDIENAYHPSCQITCKSPPPGSTRDPAVWAYYHGVCPKSYPYGLYQFAQNIVIADLEDPELLHWLQEDCNLGLFSYLSDLEYLVYEEFHTFLWYPIVMFHFKRYSKNASSGIDQRVKVIGLGHGVVPVTATTTLANIQQTNIDYDTDTRNNWRNQIFFSIRCALKRDYFDAFLSIHSFLDSFKNY